MRFHPIRRSVARLTTVALGACAALAVLVGPGASSAQAGVYNPFGACGDRYYEIDHQTIVDFQNPKFWLATIRLYYGNGPKSCRNNAADITLEGVPNQGGVYSPHRVSISICTTENINTKWCRPDGWMDATWSTSGDEMPMHSNGHRTSDLIFSRPSAGKCVLVQAYIEWPPFNPFPYGWSKGYQLTNTITWAPEIFGHCG